ncbi:MAG: hypothetical protein EOO12_00640 [Chitinophagaceae bacterium]|nr:MAG: hypothetical protein EOO12_00640 [Chitinophagaceae bacterium]
MKQTIATIILLMLGELPFTCLFGQTPAPTDSVTTYATANPGLKAGFVKKLFLGENYRQEWTTPLQVPILNLRTAFGGLTPLKEGGGKQTHSLQVADSTGRIWALRSVRKYPESAVPEQFRGSIVDDIVNNAISASYPLGAISVAPLAEAAGVPYYRDSLVFIPDDPLLGAFREKFRNTLVLMEDKDPVIPSGQNAEGQKKLLSTNEAVFDLANKNRKVDQLAVLRARLLDNFIMDFDRHEGQWKWMTDDSNGVKMFVPVPSDRDQAFFTNTGILPFFAKSKGLLPETQGFRAEALNIRSFNRAAQNFDRYFLNELSEEQWSREIDRFLDIMTDSLIDASMNRQPAAIRPFAAQKIIQTLKAKKSSFRHDMLKYYRYLAHTVTIVGTNAPDRFEITNEADGAVTVTVVKRNKPGQVSDTIYRRRFDPGVTDQLRLYALEGDDQVLVRGSASPIRLKIIGGPGNDTFVNESSSRRLFVYDVSFEQNALVGAGFKKKINDDPLNNEYRRLNNYSSRIAPFLAAEYATDGGLFLGMQLTYTSQLFRKKPYDVRHAFFATKAVNGSSFHFRYSGHLVQVFRNTNLLISGDLKLPTVRTGFYGIGNNTVLDKSKPEGHEYYLAHYNLADVSFSFRDSLNSWLTLKGGPLFQYFSMNRNQNSGQYIDTFLQASPGTKISFDSRTFAGLEAGFEVNTTNSKIFPTRGIRANSAVRYYGGIGNSNSLLQLGGELNVFTDIIAPRHLVLASAFGADHNFGDYEFYQAQQLGFKQHLRGYRIQRFSGRSRAYNNTEVRWKIGQANLYVLKGAFGLLAFNDVARVWADGEKSSTWHHGYGGGLWMEPFDRFVVSGNLTYSDEERRLLLITFGFQF